jgi:hypothetical protein
VAQKPKDVAVYTQAIKGMGRTTMLQCRDVVSALLIRRRSLLMRGDEASGVSLFCAFIGLEMCGVEKGGWVDRNCSI